MSNGDCDMLNESSVRVGELPRWADAVISLCASVIAIYSMQPYTSVIVGNAVFWWAVIAIVYSSIFVLIRVERPTLFSSFRGVIVLYICWVAICCLMGMWVANGYWEWKALVNDGACLCMPLFAYLSINAFRLCRMIRWYVTFVVPLGVVVFLSRVGGYSSLFGLFPVVVLFAPYVGWRWSLALVFLNMSIPVVEPGTRSLLIKSVIPFALLLGYYCPRLHTKFILRWVVRVLFVGPILLLAVGYFGSFNVLDFRSYLDVERVVVRTNFVTGDVEERDLRDDTRTFIYREVLATARKYDCWIAGRTPAHGNETYYFADGATVFSPDGVPERLYNEVSNLNVFMWTGGVGLCLHSLLLYIAARRAVDGANFLIRAAGVFVAFRWAYGWVEDINVFSVSYLSLWILVGLCVSPWLHSKNDNDLRALASLILPRWIKIS